MGTATQKAIPLELRAFGTVEPNASVAVRSQVSGVLTGVHFEKGRDVKKGALLFTIDARPAKAEKQLALANLARDNVQHENARREAQRQKGLLDKKLVSQEQYEKAQAAAEALAATILADEASVQSAKLKVEYSAIRSPINGRTGDLLVHQGNLVRAGDQTLVTINQVSPIRVAFALPQSELSGVMSQLAKGAPRVEALIPGFEDAAEPGKLVLVDNAVDRSTGTIKLWAEFENRESLLWPGQLVNVVLTLSVQQDALTVPLRAVQTGQKGSYVFVVGPDNKVQDRFIAVGKTHGDDVVVFSGLLAGERVVTDGQLRLKPGSKIAEKTSALRSAAKP